MATGRKSSGSHDVWAVSKTSKICRMKRMAPATIAFLLATLAASATCRGQQPATPADLQKQLDALKAQVSSMQKDLDEIKALLTPLRSANQPPRPDMTVNLGGRPVKGDASARLVLVEFTDYQ